MKKNETFFPTINMQNWILNILFEKYFFVQKHGKFSNRHCRRIGSIPRFLGHGSQSATFAILDLCRVFVLRRDILIINQ